MFRPSSSVYVPVMHNLHVPVILLCPTAQLQVEEASSHIGPVPSLTQTSVPHTHGSTFGAELSWIEQAATHDESGEV